MQGSVISGSDIKKLCITGGIYISPFDENNIKSSSYDVRLGRYFYRNRNVGEYFCPWNPEHLKSYWEEKVSTPIRVDTPEMEKRYGAPIGSEIIVVRPHRTILGHTQEFIGGRIGITTMMKARSSLGRSDVTVCRCAGWGDVGYINRWTMEITNNTNSNLVLIVGQRIAQIIFFNTSSNKDFYEGSYNLEHGIWKPEMMLPKLRLDKNLILED